MSMHEIEDLVSETIQFLDKNPDSLDLRSVFWNLYRYQEKYDTGITLFRVEDILVKHRYLCAFSVAEFPGDDKFKEYLNSLNEFTSVLRNPEKEWDPNSNPEIGCYFKDSKIFVEAGRECHKNMSNNGIFTGKDADVPQIMKLTEIANKIINLAVQNSRIDIAAFWYKVGLPYGLMAPDRDYELLKKDPILLEIRNIAAENKLIDYKWAYGVDYVNDDMLAEIKAVDDPGSKFLLWWFFVT